VISFNFFTFNIKMPRECNSFIVVIAAILIFILLCCQDSYESIVGGEGLSKKKVHWPDDSSLTNVKYFNEEESPATVAQ
jgi:hypothetical protein